MVLCVSVNVISTVLDSKFQGICKPVKVRLSPPSRFKSVVGVTELIEQVIVSAVKAALLFT